MQGIGQQGQLLSELFYSSFKALILNCNTSTDYIVSPFLCLLGVVWKKMYTL